jgi:predicted ATPase
MDLPHEGLRLGRYELVRRLGVGGMGEVWEAVLHGPEGFRRPVALKLLHERTDRPTDWQSLVHEARLGALLSHPNVVGTHDLGQVDGRWYLAMELVRGPTLSDLGRERPLPPLAVVDAGLGACAALAHIHGLVVDGRPAGLVHRDLKPSNLLLDRSGLVKVADLGIARLRQGPGEGSGTPGYMAPEQAEGREDARADLFALGVTLYVLATNVAPFGTGVRALLQAGRVEELLREGLVGRVEAAVPGLGPIVARCLRFDPEERWPDAGALGAALASLRTRLDGDALVTLLGTEGSGGVEVAGTPRDVRDRASARTVALIAGNLPPQRDAFFGRRAEVDDLTVRIRDGARNVVLKGPGGAGKTRLSLAVAREVATELAGGSWFFALADATTAAGVCAAVAAALQVPPGHQDPVRQLARAMAYRGRALFVFDNVEQVAHALPETLGRWLELVPEATFLVTTRVAPRLAGEQVVELDPLEADDAVELFLDRSPRPPSVSERVEVGRLVDELERSPLAIELAAARTRVMSVARIRQRLGERLRLLADGDRDRPARQRSMTASLDASWDLASPAARSALVQLTVFEGGFTLEAADGVVDLRGVADARWMVDVVAELVDASLVRADRSGDRFRMAVIVAEWARSRADAGVLDAAVRRHAAWFAQWGTEASVDWLRGGGLGANDPAGDLDNLVAAARRMVAAGEVGVAATITHAAVALLLLRGPLSVLQELAGLVLSQDGVPGSDQRRLWFVLAAALADGGAPADARRALAEARRLAEAQGHATTQVTTLGMEARLAQREGHTAEAADRLASAAAAAVGAGPEAALSVVLHRGLVEVNAGRLTEARTTMEEALRRARALGDTRRESVCRNNLGLSNLYLGALDAAAEHMGAALALCVRIGDRRGEVVARSNLGSVQFQRGRLEDARAAWIPTVQAMGEIGDDSGVSTTELLLGMLDHEAGHVSQARRRLTTALEGKRRVGSVVGEMQVRTELGALELAAGDLARAEAELAPAAAWAHGAGHHHLVVLVEARLASLALARGDLDAAEAAVVRAETAAATAGTEGGLALLARGRFALARGRTDEAVTAFSGAVAAAEHTNWVLYTEARLELAVAQGRSPATAAVLAEVEQLCADGGFGRLQALARARRVP